MIYIVALLCIAFITGGAWPVALAIVAAWFFGVIVDTLR